MAQTGPSFTGPERKALLDYLHLFLAAGEAAHEREIVGMTPGERWLPYQPAGAAADLPHPVSSFLARYGWHTSSVSTSAAAISEAVAQLLTEAGQPLNPEALDGALVAAAFWIDPAGQSAFTDDASLIALEELNGFINGFAQSLPFRRVPDERPDSNNLRFRAYQRRRFGYDSTTRSPQSLIKRLPPAAQELIDAYGDRLVYTSRDSAYYLAEHAAVALGRPMDTTISHQLAITLATALVWRDITEFSKDPNIHPLLGARNEDTADRWDPAMDAVQFSLGVLGQPAPSASSPAFVNTPARVPVAEIPLDAVSLAALAFLRDYVHTFATYLRMPQSRAVAASERLAAFDRSYRGAETPIAESGTQIVDALPPGSTKVVAAFQALAGREADRDTVAEQMSIALGDTGLVSRCRQALEVAAAWSVGTLSHLERGTGSSDETETGVRHADLDAFGSAKRSDVEGLLRFGTSVGDLVRYSRKLQGGQAPAGWWVKFHRRNLGGNIPTPLQFLERLPDGSKRLVALHSKMLASESFGDLTVAPRALAKVLKRTDQETSARTLAVALAVAGVWNDLERISRGRRIDTLLGAEPMGPREVYMCERAQAQLDWGLRELLETDTAAGF